MFLFWVLCFCFEFCDFVLGFAILFSVLGFVILVYGFVILFCHRSFRFNSTSHELIDSCCCCCCFKIGQYKTWTADCGLRTTNCGLGIKIRTRHKTRTAKYGLGIKHGLGIKRGLRTEDWV